MDEHILLNSFSLYKNLETCENNIYKYYLNRKRCNLPENVELRKMLTIPELHFGKFPSLPFSISVSFIITKNLL